MNENVIEVQGLVKCFAGKKVVKGVDLNVKKGEVFGFLGPNGSGKTTTIRMLCGLLKPDDGSGHCLNYDLLSQTEQIKQHVGYMTQKFSLYTELSIEENLHFIAQIYGVADRKNKVAEALENLGLVDRRNQLTGELSGGWKQRVALASCLLHNPDLLLLDEPTAGVDPIARREFWDQIHLLSDRGITALISTHYMDEAERCTRIAYLSQGHILTTGTVQEVIDATQLKTWEIKGQVTTTLLQKTKQLKGIVQAALFGNVIHVCGYDRQEIEQSLKALQEYKDIKYYPIDTTLEDAFISLVKKEKHHD